MHIFISVIVSHAIGRLMSMISERLLCLVLHIKKGNQTKEAFSSF
jgi:hypothetical protein